MATAFTGMKTFHISNGSYTNCMTRIMKLDPNGDNYYLIGFQGFTTALGCGKGNETCTHYVFPYDGVSQCGGMDFMYMPNKAVTGNPVIPADYLFEPPGMIANTQVSKNTFNIFSAGRISSDSLVPDIWRIDENKGLVHVQVGF